LEVTTVVSGNGGASRVVKIRDASVQAEKTLCPLLCPETSLLMFLPSCRAVELLDQVVTASGGNDLDVLHSVEHGNFPKSCAVTPKLVDMDDLRHVVFSQQSLEERSGGLGVAVFLKEDIQHGSMFVDGPPQPVFDTAYVHAHLVKVPSGTPTGFPMA